MRRSGKVRVVGAALALVSASIGGLLIGSGVAAAAGPPVSGVALTPAGVVPTNVVQGGTSNVPAFSFSLTTAAGTIAGTDVFKIDVSPNGSVFNSQNHAAGLGTPEAGSDVQFSAVPTVCVSAAPGGQTAPTITDTLTQNPSDNPSLVNPLSDQLNLTVATVGSGGSTYIVTVGGVGTATATGCITGAVVDAAGPLVPLGVAADNQAALGAVTMTGAYASTVISANSGAVAVPSLATVITGLITANSPGVAVPQQGATGLPMSVITITEPAAASLALGTVSITPVGPAGGTYAFNAGFVPTVTTGSGSGAGISGISIVAGVLNFHTSGSVIPTTYTITGLALNATETVAGTLITVGAITGDLADTGGIGTIPATFRLAAVVGFDNPIAGIDLDATSVASLKSTYPATGAGTCPANGSIVIATDANFPDALAASFLAGYLHTGTVLTNPGYLSPITQTALQNEGISTVYLVGGPFAIGANVVSQIQAQSVYNCGGTALASTNATTINVIRIYGADAQGTAAAIAEYPTPLTVGRVNLSGAFAHAVNYNDTGDLASTSGPNVPTNTAIVATVANFPDAMAAGPLAYSSTIPVLLTDQGQLDTETSSALLALGIQQVIVMGGPLAVSDATVASIKALNIPVLRVAGIDATDTAQLFAQLLDNSLGFSNVVGGVATLNVARGDFYADGLTSADRLGPTKQPLLITENTTTVGQYLTTYANNVGASGVLTLQQFGGALAITPATSAAIGGALSQG